MIVVDEGEELRIVTQPDHARFAAELLSLWRSDGLPDDTVSGQMSHSLSFVPAGDEFIYGCRAISGGDTVFSDWRRVRIGNPPPGDRAVPVLYNTGRAQGVDILLIETIFDTLNAKAAIYAVLELEARLGRKLKR